MAGKRCLAGFEAATPEAEGLSKAPLDELKATLKEEVHDLNCLAGAAHVVLRRGRCVSAVTDGWANIKDGLPFGLDTICRLHGCTKPLVSSAFLTLVDAGKVRLSDPIADYLPFSEQVQTSRGSLQQVKERPTLRHLLTMTAGLKYTLCPAYSKIMRAVKSGKISDLAGLCEGLAAEPLQFQPGTRYEYSFCTDFLGRVCEVVSGESLDVFVHKALLRPLGMKDTYFLQNLPPAKQHRVAVMYDCKALPASKRRKGGPTYHFELWDHPHSAPGIMSAGGGVMSYKDPGMMGTARDYARFCQMLLDGGKAQDGRQVLKESTVRSIWCDALAPYGRPDGRLPGWHDSDGPKKGGYWDFCAWTLIGTHLDLKDPPRAPGKAPRKGVGMWMAGGDWCHWCVYPKDQLAVVSLSQQFGGREDVNGRGASNARPYAVEAVELGNKESRKRKRSA